MAYAYPHERIRKSGMGQVIEKSSHSGLTKKEWMATHLMAASIAANDHFSPCNMTKELAREHARSATMLTRMLLEELKDL